MDSVWYVTQGLITLIGLLMVIVTLVTLFAMFFAGCATLPAPSGENRCTITAQDWRMVSTASTPARRCATCARTG